MVKNRGGFSLVELMVTLLISTFVIAIVYTLLGSAQSSFFNNDASIDLRNSLRNTAERMSLELRQTGYQAGVAQFSLLAGAGTGGSDIVRFSIPTLCSATSTLLNASGNPANWGAPLSWGCDTYTCMDPNADCATLEYKFIQYSINGSNELVRSVLSSGLTTVSGSTAVMGHDIVGFTATLSGNVITMTIVGQKMSAVRRTINVTYTTKVLINNLGG